LVTAPGSANFAGASFLLVYESMVRAPDSIRLLSESRGALEVGCELLDYALNECGDPWEVLHPEASLAKRDADRELNDHAHLSLRLGTRDSKACELHFVFKRLPGPRVTDIDVDGDEWLAPNDESAGIGVENGEGRVERLVFVPFGVVVDDADGTVARIVPTRVRLQRLDSIKVSFADAFEGAATGGRPPAGIGDNRERGVVARLAAIQQDELPREVVKRGAQVVEEVAKDQPEAEGGFDVEVEVGYLPTFVRLSLAGNRVRFPFLVGSHFSLQGFQVLFGSP
jgi:hypothetical protein